MDGALRSALIVEGIWGRCPPHRLPPSFWPRRRRAEVSVTKGERLEPLEIENRNLAGSRLAKVDLTASPFKDVKLTGSIFENLDGKDIKFEDANLSYTLFSNVNLAMSSIADADLSHVAIRNSNLSGMTIEGVEVGAMLELWRETHGS
jgi:uncharacterized protein YjbI with pentapeptide repeats